MPGGAARPPLSLERYVVVQDLAAILPFVAIALVFWLLLIRPQQRRARELGAMQQSLSVGDEVMLTSGVHGTVRELGDDTLRLEIAPGVVITVARGAVGRVEQPHDQGDAPHQPADPEENGH